MRMKLRGKKKVAIKSKKSWRKLKSAFLNGFSIWGHNWRHSFSFHFFFHAESRFIHSNGKRGKINVFDFSQTFIYTIIIFRNHKIENGFGFRNQQSSIHYFFLVWGFFCVQYFIGLTNWITTIGVVVFNIKKIKYIFSWKIIYY